MSSLLRYVLLGPPASGKGTQGRRLATEKDIAYLSTGALLRQEMRDGTELGIQAKVFLDQGKYLPDDLIIPIVQSWFEKHPTGWVLDGFPRTVPQAKALDIQITRAISLDVPVEELELRVSNRIECPDCHYSHTSSVSLVCPKCQTIMAPRADDDLENFRSRHAQYSELTIPVADYYKSLGLLTVINGSELPDQVFQNLIKSLH